MKKTILFILALVSFCLSAEEETEATVWFWNDFELGDEITTEYENGSIYTFNKGHFIEEEVTIRDALNSYASTYTALKNYMSRVLKPTQVSYNMGIWAEAMSGEMFRGIAEQQKIDAARIEDAKGTTEQAAKDVAQVMKDTTANMLSLKGSLEGQLSQVTDGNSQLISGLASAISQNKTDMEQKIAELKNNLNADDATVRNLQAQVQEYATKIAASEAAISKLQESMKEGFVTDVEKYLLVETYTNEIKRVSKWLGSDDDDNPGIFMKPKMLGGGEFDESDSILDYLDDYGMVSYYSISNQHVGVLPMKYSFREQIVNGKTNIVCTFNAVNNWADGGSIRCSNGVYSVAVPISSMTNLLWSAQSGSITNQLYGEKSPWNELLGYYYDIHQNADGTFTITKVETGKSITNTVFMVTNRLTDVINNHHALDGLSVWTNGNKQIEVKGFQSAPNNLEYDFYPVRVFDGESASLEWQTNQVKVIERIIHGKKNPKAIPKSVADNGFNAIMDWLIEYDPPESGLVYHYINITNHPFKIVNADDMLDNKSIWTNGSQKVEVKGFGSAQDGTVPVVRVNPETGVRTLNWSKSSATADSDAIYDIVGSEAICFRTIDASDDFMSPTNDVFMLHGFIDASENQIPYKKKVYGGNSYELAWKDATEGGGGYAIKIVGTTNTNFVVLGAPASVTNTVTFASAQDSNVNVNVSGSSSSATITIGVYYK